MKDPLLSAIGQGPSTVITAFRAIHPVSPFGTLAADVPEHARLCGVLLDQITRTPRASLQLKLPSDARARRVARKVQADLSAKISISQLVRGSGGSVRTIERLFRKETGMTFARWRQQARALHALERLAAGDLVTEAGLAIGYEGTSAFIAMFKRVLGTTPGSYFSNPERNPRNTMPPNRSSET